MINPKRLQGGNSVGANTSSGLSLDYNAYDAYIDVMAVLNIRNLPDEIHGAIRVRAAKAGRSMEAEARAILTDAVAKAEVELGPDALQEWVATLYDGCRKGSAVDDLIEERRREAAQE